MIFVYICMCINTYINTPYSFFLDNTGFSQEIGPSRVGEDILTHGGKVNDSGKKMLPLLNPRLTNSWYRHEKVPDDGFDDDDD